VKKIELSQAIGILANVGVIAGLVFVGYQLRQDRAFAIVESVGESAADRKYWAELVADNPDVWLNGAKGEELSDADKAIFEWLEVAFDMQYFTAWSKRSQLGNAAPDPVAIEAAMFYYRYPGLRAARRARIEQREETYQRIGEPIQRGEWDRALDTYLGALED
jgi:hypothetical protein